MEHQPGCRCAHSRDFLNNNHIPQAQSQRYRHSSVSAHGEYGVANAIANDTDNDTSMMLPDDSLSQTHSYVEESYDSDDTLTEFSHASSTLTFHDRSCCVTLCTCTCHALSYVFCIRESMGCLSRVIVAFLWLVSVAVICSMVTRYGSFTDSSHVMTSADMRLMDQGVSTIFCTRNVISGADGEHTTDVSQYFETYLLPWKPGVLPNTYYNQTLHYNTVVLAPDSYRYYQFYFLQGSIVNLAFRVTFRKVTFMVIRGEDSFEHFKRSPNCGYECAFYITTKSASDDQVRFSFAVYDNTEFYFVFVDGYENWRIGSEFSVDFLFQRTRYDLAFVKSSCASRVGTCRYNLEFASTEVVLVVMPAISHYSMSISSSCSPRGLIYVIFFVLTPFSILMLATVVIYTMSKLCRCLSRNHTLSNHQPSMDYLSEEYDILPTFENLAVTESTPLLNPSLPTYDQAVSERLAEDMMRADPPPSYQASIQC